MRKRPYTYIVSEGQTLEDVAITAYGDLEGVYLLALDNPGLSIGQDTQLVAGQKLRIASQPLSLDTVAYFEAREYRVNTGLKTPPPSDPGPAPQPAGFDYPLDFPLA